MKLKVVLVVSLLFNLLLAAKWLGSRPPAVEVATTNASPPVVVVEKRVATRPTGKFDWRLVESEDYRQYIQNLRSIGCPEETIRDIIVADVNKLYETKRLSLVSAKDDFKFWKAGQSLFSTTDGVKLQAEMKVARELMDEKRMLLKELLGVDIPDSALAPVSVTAPQYKMLAFLPADKRMQVQDLDQKYNLRRMQSLPGGAMGAAAGDALRKLEAEKAVELAKILTPQELEEYQLRTHPTAMTMRLQLTGFEPSEEEFREIFHAKKAYDEQYGGFFGVAPRNAEEHEKKLKAEEEFQSELKQALGEKRYADYQREQDWAYRAAVDAAERNGLPKDTAIKVYQVKKAAEEQATKLREDSNLSVEDRQSGLRVLQAETERTLTTTFGDRAFQAYKVQPGSSWLLNLAPAQSQSPPQP